MYDDEDKTINTVAVVINVRSFDSGNSNRDSEAVAVLDALKYPSVTFVSDEIQQNGETLTVKEKLTFHGITKSFSITAVRKGTDKTVVVSGKMNINMPDFEVKPPSLIGMSIRDNIRIDFTMSYRL